MTSVNVDIQGREQLVRELRALGGPRLRQVARKVATRALRPVLGIAKANAPVGETGRLAASIGQLSSTNRRGDAFSSRVGTRRDFTYKTTSGEKRVSGRGKVRDRAIGKGYSQDTKTAQQYARLIEFGTDRNGRIRRKAGGAHFLENAITSQQTQIVGTVESELRRVIDTPT